MMTPSRAEALARLAAFVPRAGRAYRATRNEDRGPDDRTSVSVLGPYIRARLITEEEVVRAVLARHSLSSAEKFVQEVFWRTYWKGWLEARPLVWRDYRRELDTAYEGIEHDAEGAAAYRSAIAGTTDIPAFNAWRNELVESGYLHNHARMWFASIWIFTLRLPWTLGADFFMRHLLCGDPASNTLSWRWVAGLHTRGKAYRATPENIRRYTGGRLEPGARLAKRVEALSGPAYEPEPLPLLTTAVACDEPTLLLLHDDDMGVETLPLGGAQVVATAGLSAAGGRSPQPMSEAVRAFVYGALEDTLRRSPHGEPRAIVESDDISAAAGTLSERAERCGSRTIVTPYAPVGPVRDALDALERRLDRRSVRLVRVARAFDAMAWPFATRGFFHLRSKIPHLLETLAIDFSQSPVL
jgi:deoxyribodipyrimidine photo-lyase